MKQSTKIRNEIYRTVLWNCVPAAVPAAFSCKVCSSFERQFFTPSELQKHYGKGLVYHGAHTQFGKFNPVLWIHQWAPAELSENKEKSFRRQLHCSDPAGKTRNTSIRAQQAPPLYMGREAQPQCTGSLGHPYGCGCCSSVLTPFWIPSQQCVYRGFWPFHPPSSYVVYQAFLLAVASVYCI